MEGITEDRAVIYIPHNALECAMTVKIYRDGELKTLQKTLDQDELIDAVRKAEDGYFETDETAFFTPQTWQPDTENEDAGSANEYEDY